MSILISDIKLKNNITNLTIATDNPDLTGTQ